MTAAENVPDSRGAAQAVTPVAGPAVGGPQVRREVPNDTWTADDWSKEATSLSVRAGVALDRGDITTYRSLVSAADSARFMANRPALVAAPLPGVSEDER